MKPITQITNVEKAKLLHQLFPCEIPRLLEYMDGLCKTIQELETTYRAQWDNGLFSFDFWLNLIKEVESKIRKYGKRFYSNSNLFADQLFDGYLAVYMVHGLSLYTKTRQHTNRKFTVAVELFFNP